MQCQRGITCPMRDGVSLSMDFYRPEDQEAHPVILMRTPYTKATLDNEWIYRSYKRYVDRGYIVIVMDCRGTGESEGELCCNAQQEYADGYDTVEWIAAQPWCDGSVGMMGLSYFGFTQLATASLAPKALKAICPFMTQSLEPFSMWLTHTYNYAHIGWIYGQLTAHMERFIPDPVLRERLEPVLRSNMANLNTFALCLPANRNPAALVEGAPLLRDYLDIVNGIEDKAFWDSLNHPTDFSHMHAAMFHCTGWFDATKDTTLHNYAAEMAQSDAYTRENTRLLIGPWCHGGEFSSVYDGYDFGMENDGGAQDVSGMMLNWFERYLKGYQSEKLSWPRVRYFVLGANRWLEDTAWPPAASESLPLYLRKDGCLSLSAGEEEAPDAYLYDPMDPAPASIIDSKNRRLLANFSEIENREDILTYETEPLTQALWTAGTAHLCLFASTDAVDTDFACRLLDVFPDGTAFPLAAGLVRAKYRKGMFHPELLQPGELIEYDIEIGNIGNCFLTGHRVKVQVTSALFPLHDRNLNTGEPSCACDHCVTAHQTIYHDAQHPSRLLLPVIKPEEDGQ